VDVFTRICLARHSCRANEINFDCARCPRNARRDGGKNRAGPGSDVYAHLDGPIDLGIFGNCKTHRWNVLAGSQTDIRTDEAARADKKQSAAVDENLMARRRMP